MAKKLSRKQRKQQRQKQLNVVKKQSKNLSQKSLNTIPKKELDKLYNSIVTEQKKQNSIRLEKLKKEEEKRLKSKLKYEKSLELLEYKKQSLIALGFDEKFLKTSYLRKIKRSDIDAYKSGDESALSVEKYPFLYDSFGFDFNREYSFGDKGLYLAWLDYFGEHSLEELINRFKNLSNETLIQILDGIIHQTPTYDKSAPNRGAGTSSGRAGGVNTGFYTDATAKMMFDSDNRNIAKGIENEKKKRVHTGSNKLYQLATSDGSYTIKKISGRQLLILLNAIFYNITEDTRFSTYSTLYKGITSRIPDFKKILPKP